MLTFKRGTYTLTQMETLNKALEGAIGAIDCSGWCEDCRSKKVCRDITAVRSYIETLIATETKALEDKFLLD